MRETWVPMALILTFDPNFQRDILLLMVQKSKKNNNHLGIY